ncbi:MAG: xanthine dehydrogenase family protein molybdopterin-binding subunit, partial [Bradyrhizobium sp.]|nr:xanthine dehydrogenase family protein molybdopterin-binding subunit [Bradyrhizobium sp.]
RRLASRQLRRRDPADRNARVCVEDAHVAEPGVDFDFDDLHRTRHAGAVIQGIGYALYEAREVDSRTGDVLSGGMEDYRIPGIADTPMIDVHFDQGGFDHVLGGSVGIGEVATVPTSPAVANAILNATGVRLTELPIRPDRLVAALKGRAAA